MFANITNTGLEIEWADTLPEAKARLAELEAELPGVWLDISEF